MNKQTIKPLRRAVLQFPELRFSPREAHKLRGYFGTAFRAHSPLLHNHLEDGSVRFGYPLVQYKVIDGLATLVGLGEGAELLIRLFADIEQLTINGQTLDARAKELDVKKIEPRFLANDLVTYELRTLYYPYSQKVYREYSAADASGRREVLKRSLRGHLLMVFKGLGIWLEADQRIVAEPSLEETSVKFKNQRMLAYRGSFVTNVELPDLVGIGRSTARGFGTIVKR